MTREKAQGAYQDNKHDDFLHLNYSVFNAPTLKEAERKSTRLNSSHSQISYAVFCLTKKKIRQRRSSSTGAALLGCLRCIGACRRASSTRGRPGGLRSLCRAEPVSVPRATYCPGHPV